MWKEIRRIFIGEEEIMKTIDLNFDKKISEEEERMIGFASEKIISYDITDNSVSLTLTDDSDSEMICKKLKQLISGKGIIYKPEVYASNVMCKNYFGMNVITESEIIKKYEDGSVVLNDTGIRLFSCFDQLCLGIVEKFNPIRKKYPTIIPISVLYKTNYLATSPQYIHLCSTFDETIDEYQQAQELYTQDSLTEIMKKPKYALSPSACFHLYQELKNQIIPKPVIYTMRQNVFRNEGRFNWTDLSRLRDYNVREIVFIGDHEFVDTIRTKIMETTADLFRELGMSFSIISTSDPFIMPEMQRYRNIQRRQKVKYELQLNNNKSHRTACASYNLHGVAFSGKFNFNIEGIEVTESGCVGFGLERIVIAFLNQFGMNQNNWPRLIRENIK